MGAQAPPAGWYQDPGGPGLRYWDGTLWTEHVRALVQNPFPQAQPPASALPAAVASGGSPAGWHPDPTGRHHLRYWDGAAWTDHVGAPNGWQGTDALAAVGTAPIPAVGAGGYPPAYGAQTAPQPAWGAPPGTPGRTRVQPIALIGAAAILVSVFLPWFVTPGGGGTANAFDTPVTFLFDPTGANASGFNVGIVLVILAVGGAALTFVSSGKAIRRSIGSVVVVVGVLFAIQVVRLISDLGGDVGDSLKVVGVGVYVAIVGGVLVAAGK